MGWGREVGTAQNSAQGHRGAEAAAPSVSSGKRLGRVRKGPAELARVEVQTTNQQQSLIQRHPRGLQVFFRSCEKREVFHR